MSGTKPLLRVERRGMMATFVSLYRGDDGFRFLTDLALIGGIVFAVLTTRSFSLDTAAGPNPPVESVRPIEGGFPEYAAILEARKKDKGALALLAAEFETDVSNFNSSPPEVREILVKVAELDAAYDAVGAGKLLAPLDLNDPNVAYMASALLIAQPSPKAQRQALDLLEEAARKGQRQASTVLGMASMLGFGGATIDKEAGRAHLERAAAAGDVFAARLLGWSLNNGWFGNVDLSVAARYIQQAADGGSAPAMVEMAGLYFAGRGVPADSLKSLDYAIKAAEAGSAEGQVLAGFIYLLQYGMGTQKLPQQAVAYLEMALTQNQMDAALVLGEIYTSTAKEPEWHDPQRGAAYFKRCADALHAKCLFAYASSLETGTGVSQDLVQAFAYYALADEGGIPRALERLKNLRTRLTAKDQERAIGVARELVATYTANPPPATFSRVIGL